MGLLWEMMAHAAAYMQAREERGRAQSAGAQPTQAKGAGSSPYLQAWLTGTDTLPSRIESVHYPYAQHPTVYVAVSRKSQAIAQLDVEVWPKGADRRKDKPIPNHWLPELMGSPGSGLRGDDLKQAIVTYLELKGEAFLWQTDVKRGGSTKPNRPHAIAMLPPDAMWPDLRDGEITGWKWNSPRGVKNVPLDELSVGKYFNPYDPLRGLGPLRAALIEYTTDHKAAIWDRMFFENNAMPALLFTAEKHWADEDRHAFIEEWQLKYGGPTKVGKAATLPEGVKAEAFRITQQEMDFLSGRRFTREQILSIFGVPPAIAGVFEYANYANSREQLKFFWHVTLLPIVRYLEALLTDLVQRYEPEVEVYFKIEPVLADIAAADFKEKVQTATQLFGMGFKPTAINEALSLGMPTAGQPWLDEGYLPFSVVPARQVLAAADEPDEDEFPPDDEPPDDETPDDEATDNGKEKIAGPPAAILRGVAERLTTKGDERAQRWGGLAARYGDIGRSYNRRLRSWLWELRSGVLTKLRKSKTAERLRYGIVLKDTADDLLWDSKSAKLKIQMISKRAWMQALQRGAAVLAKEAGLDIEFDLLDPRVTKFLAEKAIKIVGIEDRVREEVRAALQEGIGEGETIEQLAARVRERFDVERSRALTIARTETAQSFSTGRVESMRQVGITKHEWLTSRDTRVRDSHDALDGDVVIIGEPFKNGLTQPGEVSGPPAEIINCFPAEARVSGAAVAALRAEYVGPMVQITTRAGHQLTVTPNHPILTPDGLVAALDLREGGYLLSKDAERERQMAAPVVNHDNHGPSTIQQIFDSIAAKSRAAHRKVAADQLHGDALFAQGDIEIVLAHGPLLDRINAKGAERDAERVLVGAAVGQAKVSGYRPSLPPVHRVYGAAAGGPSPAALPPHGFGIGPDRIPLGAFRVGTAADLYAPLPQAARDNPSVYSEFLGQLLDAAAGLITLDQIVAIRELDFHGHVYDLQSVNGWIIAESIITSNCRCVTLPIVEAGEEAA